MIDEGTVAGAVQALRADNWTKDVVEDLTDRELRWIVRVTLGAAGGEKGAEKSADEKWGWRNDRSVNVHEAADRHTAEARAQRSANYTGKVAFVYRDAGNGWDRQDVIRPVVSA